jgi:hypothetical protein
MKVTTSRYANQKVIEASGLVPIGITVGQPRFSLRYDKVDVKALAPDPQSLKRANWAVAYRRKLDGLGVDQVRHLLGEAGNGQDVVLLCFECLAVHGEDSCHRRVFATWWEKHTGEEVEELKDKAPIPRPKPKVEQPTLFDVDEFEVDRIEFEPQSAAIARVNWANEEMLVEFTSGHRYRYRKVPIQIAAGWMSSRSAGRYFHRVVKEANFDWEKVEA